MEDKSFELLSKMYSEFTEFRKDMNNFRKETDSRLTQIETTLEHEIKEKIQALHERESINTDTLAEHGKQLENINNKLDLLSMSSTDQDKRLKVVEASKKKKAK